MKTRTLLALGLLLLVGLPLACAPAADFKGGSTTPDTVAPDDAADAADTTTDTTTDVAQATCETDDDCKAAWKDQVFPCHVPVCGATGACEWQAAADDEACDDHNDCTEGDACLDGQCVGDPKICDPGNDPCVSHVCVRGQGCQAVNTQAPCDDGDLCTVNDVCAEGACKGGQAIACDDLNPCTDDACDHGACTYAPNTGTCDDGNPCTTGDACKGGTCAPSGWTTCDDLADEPCKAKTCSPAIGCRYAALSDGDPCDDGDACTLGDACQQGACVGPVARSCDDGNPCTTDTCDPAEGCAFKNVAENGACDDLNPCTTGEKCKGGTCKGGTAVTCPDDGDPCTLAACDPTTGACTASAVDGLPCDDGNPCTQADTCKSGACKGGTGVPCNDGNPCTTDLCVVVGGAAVCSSAPSVSATACDDKNPCTTNDLCQPGKGTCAGSAKSCNDGNPCTTDLCNYVDGACLHVDAPDDTACESENVCLTNTRCVAGACKGDLDPCDDGDLCTADSCDADGGCTHGPATHTPDEAGCLSLGVCAGKATVTCAPAALTCDYAAATGFEPDGEVTCDGLDNDCDGLTDEGLCGVCTAGQRVCAGNDVLVCNGPGFGWEPERTCAAGSSCVGQGVCLPDADAVVAPGLDPDATRSHLLTLDADGRLLAALPVLDQGQPSMLLARIEPDTAASTTLATLGDVKVLTMASTDGRRVHVVYQAAEGANLDLHVLTVEGAAQIGASTQAVQGFQAVATPFVLDASTLAIPVATIDGDTTVLRTLGFDVTADQTSTRGSYEYSGYLVKRLHAARQVDGDLAMLYATNTQRSFLTRFAFADGAFLEPVELPNDPEPVGLASPEAAAYATVLEQDAAGAVSATSYDLVAFTEKATGYLGTTASPDGRVRGWGRGTEVLVAWEGGTAGAPEVGSSQVDGAGTVTAGPIPAGLAGFDPRYGESPLGAEWLSWRNATGELHFLKL